MARRGCIIVFCMFIDTGGCGRALWFRVCSVGANWSDTSAMYVSVAPLSATVRWNLVRGAVRVVCGARWVRCARGS